MATTGGMLGRVFSALYVQVRTKKNFFTCRREDELWKTVCSVSNAGKKKGRLATRQKPRPLLKFYRIGQSPMNLLYPGLNTPIDEKSVQEPISVAETPPEEVLTQEQFVHQMLGKGVRRSKFPPREKLHPLERGFHGPYLMGQKLGPPPPVDDVTFDDFQTYCLEMKKTMEMKGGLGRVFTMHALVVTGNGKGCIGYALGRAPLFHTNDALVRAIRYASRRLFYVELLEGRTIYQDFFGECNYTKVFAFRKPAGFGLVCHPRLKKVCELIGIKDIYVKVEGGPGNYYALLKAFLTGLHYQETHQQLAERTRLHVVELDPVHQHYPRIVASPQLSSVKGEDEVEQMERLKLDQYYGEGRLPMRKPPDEPPYFRNLPSHLFAEWERWVHRNQGQRKLRLLVDGEVSKWTSIERNKWGRRQHEEVMSGARPLPFGIGLSTVRDPIVTD